MNEQSLWLNDRDMDAITWAVDQANYFRSSTTSRLTTINPGLVCICMHRFIEQDPRMSAVYPMDNYEV